MSPEELQLLLGEAMAGESGDSSSRLNFQQDLIGSMFDPAMGVYDSLLGGPGIDWGQFFEYEAPDPEPVNTAVRPQIEAMLGSDDDLAKFVAEAVAVQGMSPQQVEVRLREMLGYNPDEEGMKGVGETVKSYASLASDLFKEQQGFDAATREYEQQMAAWDPNPKLVENDFSEKWKRAGLPMPDQQYTASDFSPGAVERADARDSLGRDSLSVQQAISDRLRSRPLRDGRSASGAVSANGVGSAGLNGEPLDVYGETLEAIAAPRSASTAARPSRYQRLRGSSDLSDVLDVFGDGGSMRPAGNPRAGVSEGWTPAPSRGRASTLVGPQGIAAATPQVAGPDTSAMRARTADYVGDLLDRIGSGAPGVSTEQPKPTARGRHSDLGDWLSGDDKRFVEEQRKALSGLTRQRNEMRPKDADGYRQATNDARARGRARAMRDMGRNPAGDAVMNRIMRSLGV